MKKIQLIESVILHFENGGLGFLLTQYKSEDKDIFIRSWVAMPLGKLENISYITLFLALLKDKDPKMRVAATKALGQICGEKTLKWLAKSLWDDDWDVKNAIAVALNAIDPN